MINELMGKFRSKRDFVKYFSENLQLYMPPEKMINKDFFKQVLREEKRLLEINKVKYVNVPHYDELSVKKFWPRVQSDDDFMKFMPDPTPDGLLPDRTYFWNVLNTVQTTYVRNVIQHANEQRMSAKADAQQEEVIDVTEAWW